MNPYKVLNINAEAGKREIVLAAAKALRQRDFAGKEVALAQKQLLDSACKPVLDFLYNFSFSPLIDPAKPAVDRGQFSQDINRLTIFDDGSKDGTKQ